MKIMMKEGKAYNLVKEHNSQVASNRRAEKWGRIGNRVCQVAITLIVGYMIIIGAKYFNII